MSTFANHKVVSLEEWTRARIEFLKKEKEFTKARDALSAARRELPWTKMPDYNFEGPNGKLHFADLFKGKSQLAVYHFMFGPGELDPCKSCSFWADNFNGIGIHLAHRDTAFAAVSRASVDEIEAYKKRMGWTFDWYSSGGSNFNYDLQVSHRKEGGKPVYNFQEVDFEFDDMPGASVFYRGDGGTIYRTYSTFGRGIDILNGAYNWLDLSAKGRDEEGLPHTMAWLRHHDRYDD